MPDGENKKNGGVISTFKKMLADGFAELINKLDPQKQEP